MNLSSSAPLRLGRWLALVLSVLLMAPGSWALAPEDVGQVNSLLKRAEANLQLVDGSIGHLTSPPKGSAGKLAGMRLAQALGDIDAAELVLAKISSGEGLAEAKQRQAAARTLYEKLDGILTGAPPQPEPVPEPKPEPVPAPETGGDTPPTPKPAPKTGGDTPPQPAPAAPKTVKLGYPHADNFKNSLYTLRRVEAEATAALAQKETLSVVPDQLTVLYRTTSLALDGITETRRQAGFVEKGLAALPANGEGVAEAKERLAQSRAQLDTAAGYFEPLNAKLMVLIDPANYPDYPTDLKRLRELSSMYANPAMMFDQQRQSAIEALAQCDAAEAECIRIAQVYARLMEQETEQGKQIENAGNGFLRAKESFLATAEERKTSLPTSIREDLKEADKYATEAVEMQKPMWFTGGIPQTLERVADKLTLLQALDPVGAKAVEKEAAAMIASIRQRGDSLRELIIRDNPLPSDGYIGKDRDDTIAVAVDAWKYQEKDFELLAVRIPAKAWVRETKWTYSNGTWYFVDRSRLQVRLIVADKNNPAQAIDRPITIWMDHQAGDSLIGVPMRSFDETLEPSEYLLRDKIK